MHGHVSQCYNHACARAGVTQYFPCNEWLDPADPMSLNKTLLPRDADGNIGELLQYEVCNEVAMGLMYMLRTGSTGQTGCSITPSLYSSMLCESCPGFRSSLKQCHAIRSSVVFFFYLVLVLHLYCCRWWCTPQTFVALALTQMWRSSFGAQR